MPQRLGWRHPLRRFPNQTPLHEVGERRLVPAGLQRSRQRPGGRRAAELPTPGTPTDDLLAAVWALGNGAVARDSLRADEVAGSFARGQEAGRGHAAELNDAGKLVGLILAREQRTARGQFGQDAAETPHVDRQAVARAEDHLGRAVETRLDVRVDALVLVTARPEINHL